MKATKKILVNLILLLMVTVIIVAFFRLWPETKSAEKVTKEITLKFSAGDKTGAFETESYTLEANEINGLITFPESFETTISMDEGSYYKKVDDETYYFTEGDYSYSFTGWKISNATTIAPSETVFQPGDKIQIETLEKYDTDGDGVIELDALWGKVIYAQNAYETMYYTDYWILDLETTKTKYNKTGAWNYKNEDGTLTLNDGKDVDNPISSVDYAYYLFYQLDYQNNFANGTSHNAYDFVIMLTGDLDYIKSSDNGKKQTNYFSTYDIYDGTYDETKHYIFGEYTAQCRSWGYVQYVNSKGTLSTSANDNYARSYSSSVTFKSKGDSRYNLYINGYGYYDNTFNSIRIDNVAYTKSPDSKRPKVISPVSTAAETAFVGREGCFVEFTARSTTLKSYYTFRPNTVQTVVVNGGEFGSWQTSYSSNQKSNDYDYDLHWYMGRNASFSGEVNLGTNSSYSGNTSVISQNMSIVITGGSCTNLYGASFGLNSKSIGERKITILGDQGSNTTSNPKINNIYGAGKEGILEGNAYVTIIGATNIKNVYGGGYAFTATTYGDTNVTIKNSTISGNVFGGGYNGNVLKNTSGEGGNVNLTVDNSTVTGNIYGSGMGGSQVLTTQVNFTIYENNTNWQETEYVPTNDEFSSVKDSTNGDYSTDWDWSKPATGFPFIQEGTNYICVAIYKETSWTNNNPESMTYKRNYVYAYFSVAKIENDVNITVNGSTVGTKGDTSKGNIYGGGSLAVVNGDTYVTVKGNSTVYGSIYGGGDGASTQATAQVYYPVTDSYTAPTYTVTRDSAGNITNVTCSNESTTYINYAYSDRFTWSDEEYLVNQNGIDVDNKLIYSAEVNNSGKVNGSTTVTIEDSTISGNAFGGGNKADVDGSTTLNITNSTITDVYGGGYSGAVGENSEVTINSGDMDNVFGGGNLGTVQGNVTVIIGNSNNPSININELLYGGGRGVDADGDGNASDFTTVYGSATVTIEGINTYVASYGSVTLGAVAGTVDVTLSNYWTGNSTNKYKVMNGIDRATNVYFKNSYVLLTNKDSSGNVQGIKSIENLYIPAESGLKVSAEGNISGNFVGGGELYLDSEVCLNIGGNITGSTKLVLNPLLYSSTYIIKGTSDKPYMKAVGTAPEDDTGNVAGDATALVSGDKRYTVRYKRDASNIIYYIDEDVIIENSITENVQLVSGREYTSSVDGWATSDINMMQDGIVTSNMKLSYQYKGEKYTNVQRSIIVKSGENEVNIPKNTKITMIIANNENTEYYQYLAESDLTEANLNEFKKIDSGDVYEELTDITQVGVGDTLTKLYTYDEEYRFVVDFAECENYLEASKTYNILMNVKDSGNSLDELSATSANTINMKEKLNAQYNAELNQKAFLVDDLIESDGKIVTNAITDATTQFDDYGKNLVAKITLKDDNGNTIEMPIGIEISVNNVKQKISQNSVIYKVETLTREAINKDFDIQVDLGKIIKEEEKLSAGTYKICYEFYVSENDILQKKIGTTEQEFVIAQSENYGLEIKLADGSVNSDKVQIGDKDKTLEIKVNKGTIQGANVKIKLQKRTGAFTYTDIKNTITQEEIIDGNLQETNTIDVTNIQKLEAGMYRIIVELYDENTLKQTETTTNFIVFDNT